MKQACLPKDCPKYASTNVVISLNRADVWGNLPVPSEEIVWEITGEKKFIRRYECLKAIPSTGVKTVTSFMFEIPLSYRLRIYYGLPRLVPGLADNILILRAISTAGIYSPSK